VFFIFLSIFLLLTHFSIRKFGRKEKCAYLCSVLTSKVDASHAINERIHRVAEAGWVGYMTYKGVYVTSCLSDSESRKFRTKAEDKATVDARVGLYKGNIVYPRVGFCVAHPSFLRAMREP